MAEAVAALGVIASVAQLADYGFKLSIKLYTFSESVYTADKSIKSISNDVSLTSTVLNELCQIIKSDDAHVVSENALVATKQTVEECLKIFHDLDEALSKSLSNMTRSGNDDADKLKKGGRGVAALERLKWPFKQSKMELLRSNLDRLKASLTLMLQVLSYARDVSCRKATETSMQYQKQMIESLARSEREMKRRYYAMQHAIEDSSQTGFNTTINATVIMAAREIGEERPTDEPPSPKSSNPVAEILLCFKLLHDFLGHTPFNIQDSLKNDESLKEALRSIERLKSSKIGERFGNQAAEVKTQAVQTVRRRLEKVMEDHYRDELSDGSLSDRGDLERTSLKKYLSKSNTLRLTVNPMASTTPFSKLESDIPGQETDSIQYMPPTISEEDPRLLELEETCAAMQVEIDEMSTQLSHHGSNLELSTQAARKANRIGSMLRGLGESLSRIGSTSYRSIRGLSKPLYEIGKVLLPETKEEEEIDERLDFRSNMDQISYIYSDPPGTEENILDSLLSEWTTLPSPASFTSNAAA